MDGNGKKMNNKVSPDVVDEIPPVRMDNLVDNTPNLGDGDPSIEDELQNNNDMFREEAKLEIKSQEEDRILTQNYF